MVVALALFFDFSNGFHDAANVVATIIVTGAMSPAMALTIAAICEFIGPFLFGTAVAQTIGKNIIDTSAFDPNAMALSAGLIIAALIGAIAWNLITWWFGLPSSSSHALIGGLIGPVLIAYGPDKIIWKGVHVRLRIADPLPADRHVFRLAVPEDHALHCGKAARDAPCE